MTGVKTAAAALERLRKRLDELGPRLEAVSAQSAELRVSAEAKLDAANGAMAAVSDVMSPAVLEQTLMYPLKSGEGGYPYGFARVPAALDDALTQLAQAHEDMLELSRMENTELRLKTELEDIAGRIKRIKRLL